MDLKGSGARGVGRPVAACAAQPHPTAADWIPLILRFQILEAWIWRPGSGGLVPGCLNAGRIGMDWNGLEWIGGGDGGDGGIGMDARWEEGIQGRPTRSSFRSSADFV